MKSYSKVIKMLAEHAGHKYLGGSHGPLTTDMEIYLISYTFDVPLSKVVKDVNDSMDEFLKTVK